ncbi:MAG: efflux RND transporter permease subunit, partial [Bacteroidales bacterium]|nr:efflux RND transporter permease subunit [Bacteroidales bacterium]
MKNKFLVLLGVAVLLAGGVYAIRHLDIDVFPDLTAPTVAVVTDAENMATEEVERLVTFPIETAVNGATHVRRVRSSSLSGASFVWVEFDWGTDIYKARQIVSEKLVALEGSLPQDITPVLAPQSSVMGEILFVALEADSTDMMELRTLADWVIKPAILATGGVSQVTVMGGDYKQYQMLADPALMNAYGVTLDEIAETAATMSLNSSGGILRQYDNEYAVRGLARTHHTEELGRSLVKVSEEGVPITLNDVGEVRVASAVRMGYASLNAHPAVLLSVSKQPNVNTLQVTHDILQTLAQLQPNLPEDIRLNTEVFRQADFIEASVHNVGRSLLEGAFFVIIILLLFLGSFRSTLISVVAIPLSLLGTVLVLYLTGQNINTMTLGGMCIAIGSLVDDAIIDVENVYKKLRRNHALPPEQRQSVFQAVYEGSTEIRASILNATFIIIVAFTPLFFLSGMEGRMLKPLGLAYIISLLMSLLVAMTVTPLLCKTLLGNERYLSRNQKDKWFSRNLNRLYGRSLDRALNHKKWTVGIAAVAFVAAVGVYFTLGHSFLPDFNEGSLTVSAVSKPGLSLDLNNKIGNTLEEQLLSIDEVVCTSRRTGRGELDEHSQAVNSAEIEVKFELKDRSKEAFLEEVRHKLAEVPGVVTSVGQPLGHRIDHILSGTQAAVAIKVFGPNLSRLYALGNQIQAEIADVPGVVDLNVEQQTLTPQLQIRANRAMLARHGITVAQFNRFVQLAFSGAKVGDIYEGQRRFDLVVRLKPPYTESMEGISNALITTASGAKVPLGEVAEIVSKGGPCSVSRENVQRKLVVSCNVAGRDVQSVVDEIRQKISQNIVLGEDYRITYGGQFESAQSASRTLTGVFIVALFIIFCLLYSEFRRVDLSALILVNLPLALIGGVFAVFFSSKVVSIPSIIGFITLFGIAIRNGI